MQSTSAAFWSAPKVPGIVERFGIPGIDHGPAYEWVCRQTDLDATLLILGLMISLTFIALSREKIEDECMSHNAPPCGSAAPYGWRRCSLTIIST